MESSLEDIQFLASSANRVRILTTLIDRRSTRRELKEEVDCSRSTVARILDEAQERGWVDAEGRRYVLTPLGETMVTDFRSYLETVEGLERFGDTINHFPPPLFSLDFHHFRDAVVVEPTAEDPAAPFTRAFYLFREATEYRGLSFTAFPDFVKVLRDGVDQGRLDFEHVVEKAFIETVRSNPERSAVWSSLSDRIWLYEGTVHLSMHIIDGTVLVWLGKSRGEAKALLESENPEVLSWAESLYEEYKTDAEMW